jgi:hypothetical protein
VVCQANAADHRLVKSRIHGNHIRQVAHCRRPRTDIKSNLLYQGRQWPHLKPSSWSHSTSDRLHLRLTRAAVMVQLARVSSPLESLATPMPFKVQGHAHHRASTNPGRSHLAIRVAAIGIKFLLARAPPPSGSPESSVPPGCQAMHIGTAHLNLGRSHIAHLGAVERQLQSQGPFIFLQPTFVPGAGTAVRTQRT